VIHVRRGRAPVELAHARAREVPKLRALGSPCSNDIKGYAIVAERLWKAQHHKCCYCEAMLRRQYNDVDHYRPKASADRTPGSMELHGYWWLAFSWGNLLFTCNSCNRSAKKTSFPLAASSVPLRAEQRPPGKEQPLLLDPAGKINPVQHIQFKLLQKQWYARPRNGSVLGSWTINICKLNAQDLLELRLEHVEGVVVDAASEINDAIAANDRPRISRAFRRATAMLNPASAFVGLTYDAFRHYVSSATLARAGVTWPQPSDVGT